MSWTPSSLPITLLLAGSEKQAQTLYRAASGDARFHVLALATSPEEVTAKLDAAPQALVLDGLLFPGPEEIADALAGYDGVCVVTLPPSVDSEAVEQVRRLACVADVLEAADWPTLAERLIQAFAGRAASPSSQPWPSGRSVATAGWRAVAVWSLQGGAGTSTLAAALALEVASRRLPTLLVGLAAPDSLPLSLNLKPEPNLAAWRRDPTATGLKTSVQPVNGLDMLAGFASPLELASYLPEAIEGPNSLAQLTGAAAQAGYAAVILDASAPELAPAALAACNSVVLVSLATLPGILGAVEALRLLRENLTGRRRIPAAAVHLVLNRVRASTLSPEEVVRNGRALDKDFPSLVRVVRDDPAVEESLNLRRPAYYHSDSLRQAVRALADDLFAPPAATGAQRQGRVGQPGRVYTLGPIRVRV